MKMPIIFSEYYDVSYRGIERFHPFDSTKYGKIFRYLKSECGLEDFFSPKEVTEEELLSVHSKEYITSLSNPVNIAKIAELSLLASMSTEFLQNQLLRSVRLATGGTILGASLAKEYGWAINLSGGYHHAKANTGGGFCFYADIPIALYKLFEKNPKLSVLIIDLDAHQGNGYASIFEDDERIHILDVYNREIYPNDTEAKRYIEFNYPVKSYMEDEEYISLVEKAIPDAIAKSNPRLIVYIAGTDILKGDELGCMGVSEEGIIKRDEIVFKNAIGKKIPILMVLGGGYTKKSALVTAKSIGNFLKNLIGLSKIV